MLSDLRFALRSLAKSPGFTVVAVFTLALGLGATTAFFSVLHGVVLRGLPYPEPDRLVELRNVYGGNANNDGVISAAELADYRARQRSFVGIAADSRGRATLATDAGAERVIVARVTANLFPLLGVTPLLGRTFAADEERAGKNQVVILSYECWQARFGGAKDILEQRVRLNGIDYTIVGVMPASFGYSETGTAFWSPLDLAPQGDTERKNRFLFAVARLLPGTSEKNAREDLARVARQLQADLPQFYPAAARWSLDFTSLHEGRVGRLKAPFGAMMAAASAVLLIACVNVAIMFLLRAAARRREIMIRLALGAARWHLARQLLAESAVICIGGMIGGLGLAAGGLELLRAFPPGEIPGLAEATINGPVAAFTAAILVAVTVLVGLAPVVSVWKTRINEGITQTTRTTESRGAARMRETLTVVEIALAVLLLVSAGLTLRSLQNLLRVDVGFSTERVLSFKTNLVDRAYPDAERTNRFYEQFAARIAALPGVTSVGAVSYLPLGGESQFMRAEPTATPPGAKPQTVGWRVVRDAYFETIDLALLSGRRFDRTDEAGTEPVAIIDEDLARRIWPGASDVLGRQLRFGEGAAAETRTIVGVVRSVRHFGPREMSLPNAYVPQSQVYQRGMFTVVKTASSPERLVPLVRAALAGIDPAVPMYYTATMERRYEETVALPRFIAGLIGAFSLLALVLAGVGIFGVTAYAVGQRTREFGIRFALGAPRSHVVGIVLGRVGRLALIGGVLGALAAFEIAGLMKTILFGVEPVDAPTLALAMAGTAVTALAASLLPVARALRVDPIESLRAE